MTPEMIERLVSEAYGLSFANQYAKQYHVKFAVALLGALTKEDCLALIDEKDKMSVDTDLISG